jgi:Pyruvate/2-oxoacid:ferredoxin oxidoreductase delta subunit
MAQDAYQKLARHLDGLPGGFPPTPDGVELRILKRLFTPEQAELATKLTLIPETAAVIARRAGLDPAEAGRRLEEMASQGLVFRYEHQGRVWYMASQYVIGIWEYQVNKLDPDLIADMRAYLPTLFDMRAWQKAPQLRTIPVQRSLAARHEVLPYEQAEELVRGQRKILVAPCICRREHAITGQACNKPEEACLVFGLGVDYYEKNGLGRRITAEEAIDILKQADKAGLVLQPSNSQKIMNICCCCGCCCQVLKSMKRHPRPAELAASPFTARLDAAKCTGCGLCLKRCQMEAFRLVGQDKKDRKAVLDGDRCIGCGLCVTTCPAQALELMRKPAPPAVPKSIQESYLKLGRARGKLGTADLAWMALKSKVDRLLAGRGQ